MKHSRPSRRCCCCCYCCWLTVLLVASSIISVSPESSSLTMRFESQQQKQQMQQSIYITTPIATRTMSYNSNALDITAITAAATIRVASPSTPPKITTKGANSTAIEVIATTSINTNQSLSISSKKSKLSNRSIQQQQQQQINEKHLLQQHHSYHQQQEQEQQQQQFLQGPMFLQKGNNTQYQTLRRRMRQAEEEQVEKCRLFVEGEPGRNELYSPDYPNNYPKNINCTRVIIAPKGQIIRLDFRNSFYIEANEDCKYDFLEIRDGQYGFSNLIGKYCGSDFPPEITSKERYLWMHFRSDESIEYSGFTAVYEFIDRNREAPSTDLNCTIELDGFEGIVNSSDVPPEIKKTVTQNKIPLDCMWRIQVKDKWKILVKFLDFKLIKPNDCETNFLDIFAEQTIMPQRKKNFCGSAGEGISSDSNILHMRFYAEQVAINSSFAILYTAFRDRTNTGCTDDEYDCEDATCISKDLMCNKHDNCKFRWDELDERCQAESAGQSEHVIIIIVVFGLLLGGMVVTFLVNCIRKIMRDQKIIREHIRQSKDSELNELGRNSKARSRDNLSIAMSPRQKHSQTSLQILDDVSSRYYREVVPISVQTSKSDLKEKEHSILRQHHDMFVQTSLVRDDSSSTATATATETAPDGGNVCDMACQTRESLFVPALIRQKSTSSSAGGGSVPPPPRFSTFGYDMQHPPPPPPPAVSTMMRRSMRMPPASSEQRPSDGHAHTHHHASGSHATAVRPQEVCHHHHQHQQHLQQQQAKFHQLQQQQQQQQQHIQQQYPIAVESHPTLPHNQRVQQQQQHQQKQHSHSHQQHQQLHTQKQHQSTATIVPMPTLPATATTAITTVPPSCKNKHQKVDESKAFLDIRNSAPDVIIMTSH